MHYGFVIPNGDVHTIPELAQEAEAAGWDGVFIPDCISIETPEYPSSTGFDPWVMLAAMAVRTERVRLGPIITAVSRRRPWKLARETATLDQLSNGRLILAVGLGAANDDAGFYKVGEAMERKTRAELLDESLDILAGLWSGKPFHYDGQHYHIREMTLLPPPIQTPRIPIWVVGAWLRPKSFQRALHWDGILPSKMLDDGSQAEMEPADITAMKQSIEEQRVQIGATGPFDIVVEGTTPGKDSAQATAKVLPYVEAGATWWNEAMWSAPNSFEDVRTRICQGPPRIG